MFDPDDCRSFEMPRTCLLVEQMWLQMPVTVPGQGVPDTSLATKGDDAGA
jgi:hypothetical protein